MFTPNDEVHERSTVSPKEMKEINADVRGDVSATLLREALDKLDVSVDDDATLLREALDKLDGEILLIPDSRKAVFLEAQRTHPELVGDPHKTLFLRVEEFDAKLAAERLVKYWQERHKLFGREKCFLPLTLKGALRDDIAALSQGVHQFLPCKDPFGRAVMFSVPSRHDKSKYSCNSMLRALWYLYHVALEDPNVQKKGKVSIIFPKDFSMHQYDPEINRKLTYQMWHILPMRDRAIHLCHPPVFVDYILPIWKFFLGRRQRLRFNVHSGSENSVLQGLSLFGLRPDLLPTELGGKVVLDPAKWIAERKCLEESRDRTKNYPACRTTKKNVTRVGRKGDTRMKRAVEEKQKNPDVTLFNALIAGGFEFSLADEPGLTDKYIFDANGVSLYQRKNQLNRRLREARRKCSTTTTVPSTQKNFVAAHDDSAKKRRHPPSDSAVSSDEDKTKSARTERSSPVEPQKNHRRDVPVVEISESTSINVTSVSAKSPAGMKREDSFDSFIDQINSLPGLTNVGNG